MSNIDVLSALRWWQDAGVDMLVDETPRDWLRPAEKAPPVASPPPSVIDDSPSALPATLEAFCAWLATTDSLPGEISARLAPAGDPAAGLMLLADIPDPADARAAMLVSGEIGRLFDRMLAAIGRDRASIYLATMAPARPAGGRTDAATVAQLIRSARHHVMLAEPRLLVLLGEAASRAMLGIELAEARGRVHMLDHEGGSVPAVATFHPRFLIQHPALKADAWQDLRLVLQGLSR